MLIAMNQFQVAPGRGEDFERMWRERESYLADMPGFVRFALLRGDDGAYISHSTWASREAFEAWTQSEQFVAAHRSGGSVEGVLTGHPELRIFESVIEEEARTSARSSG
jgi:heme-degrading monooxygenase HmoA